MRLIDADNINFHCNYDGDCTGDIDSCKECENYICDFRDIQEQPTAYSVDKVVEELERFPLGNLGCQELNEIIEIVKHGGVADDVCECKKHRVIDDIQMYSTSCLHELEVRCIKKYKYCPYCGKKIKVVK